MSYYRKVLAVPAEVFTVDGHCFDLRREAAINLALILRLSGQGKHARQLVDKYVV